MQIKLIILNMHNCRRFRPLFFLPFALLGQLFLTTMPLASRPTWTGVEIRSFAQTKSKPDVMYASGGGGLFVSLNRGERWEPIKIPRQPGWRNVLVVPENHEHVILWQQGYRSKNAKPHPLRFLESRDSGREWAWKEVRVAGDDSVIDGNINPMTDFHIDRKEEGGAWWIVAGGVLLRSLDHGATWAKSANDVQDKLLIVHTPTATFRISGNTLYGGDKSGNEWKVLHEFPVSEGQKESHATDMFSLADKTFLLRVNGAWFRVSVDDQRVVANRDAMKSLPDSPSDRVQGGRSSSRSNWYCRVRQPEDRPDSLFAFCSWDNRSWPSSLCLYRSEDGGRSWGTAGRGRDSTDGPLARCDEAFPHWSPISIWLDRADPSLLLASWMAGGVIRSEDAGHTWKGSDQGLRYKKPGDPIGHEAVHETPLVRAVMERDIPTLETLLANGAAINAPGNYISGVLDADLFVVNWTGDAENMLYRYLRDRGANLPPRRAEGSQGILEKACYSGLVEIVRDLVDHGYDWAYVPKTMKFGFPDSTELHDCIRRKSDSDELAGRPLAEWVERYINAAKFPSADQVAYELFLENHPTLGLKVVKAASSIAAFDRQQTPQSPYRISIIPYLWEIREYSLAKRVFFSLNLRSRSEFEKNRVYVFFGGGLDFCEPKIIGWYFQKGWPVTAKDQHCLENAEVPLSKRKALLALIDTHQGISAEYWARLIEKADTRWAVNTPQYRRHLERSKGR